MRGVVKEVDPKKIVLNDGTEVPYGLLVWSTGVGPSQFVKSLDLPKSPGGRYLSSSSTQFFADLVSNFLLLIILGNAGSGWMSGYRFLRWKMFLRSETLPDFLNRAEGLFCLRLPRLG